MACDGSIDKREVDLIYKLCNKSVYLKELDFEKEINNFLVLLNSEGKRFISNYFDLLRKTELSEKEELTIIDFAIQTIKADDQIEYSEIKFFKVIRKCLRISDQKILETYPDLEQYLEEDIATDSLLDKLTKSYLDSAELPIFKMIKMEE